MSDEAIYKDIFLLFLKMSGALDIYLHNADTSCEAGGSGHPIQFISGAFTWQDSPEGHHYWQSLDSQWQEVLRVTNITRD